MYVLFYICGAAAAACQLLNKRICYVLCYVMHLPLFTATKPAI